MTETRLTRQLRDLLGDSAVITNPDRLSSWTTDWTRRFRGTTRAVVRPATTAEVAAVLTMLHETGTAVVPQGGNTGLVGGGVPRNGEIVLDLTRLDQVGPVDVVTGRVTAGAGVTIGRMHDLVAGTPWRFGVDLASRDSATVGGAVATNAGGIHVVRHGPMRDQVMGIEVVLADGSVLEHLAGLSKDNTGYDLVRLFVGSEGTLGVITRVTLRLVPAADEVAVALLAFATPRAALEAIGPLRGMLPDLHACEFFLDEGLELVRRHTQAVRPFADSHRAYLLVEVAGRHDPQPQLMKTLAELPALADAVVASEGPGRRGLWGLRERHTEAIAAEGVPCKFDVTLPHDRLAEFVDTVAARVANVAPGARSVLFGHAADGNVHVNVLGVDPNDTHVDDTIFRLVAELGGSISSEHGIGVAKAPWLSLSRSHVEIEAMHGIKRALDPSGILNPGVILPAEETDG